VASSLDAIYEFLDSQGINLQTIELMTPNELVGLGLAPDDARRVLSEARHGGVEEYDGDVYADLEAAESAEIAELRGQNASLQQRVKELMQRCSDLQLRVSVLEEARMCCICMERKRDIVLMPCMHAMFCSTCLRECGVNTEHVLFLNILGELCAARRATRCAFFHCLGCERSCSDWIVALHGNRREGGAF
jgi:hypothetical protein